METGLRGLASQALPHPRECFLTAGSPVLPSFAGCWSARANVQCTIGQFSSGGVKIPSPKGTWGFLVQD